LGAQPGGIYQVNDRTVNGVTFYGALFVQTVTISNLDFSSYQWISVVNVDPGYVVNGNAVPNPIVDGSYDQNGCNINYPFYNLPSESSLNAAGNFAVFQDNPGTTNINYSFSAQSTLVGINSQGMTPIVSYNWGYQVTNSVTSFLPLNSANSPSNYTQNIINTINAISSYMFISH
jgi:hypothetical protein